MPGSLAHHSLDAMGKFITRPIAAKGLLLEAVDPEKSHEYQRNIKFFFRRRKVLSIHPARHRDLPNDSVADNRH